MHALPGLLKFLKNKLMKARRSFDRRRISDPIKQGHLCNSPFQETMGRPWAIL